MGLEAAVSVTTVSQEVVVSARPRAAEAKAAGVRAVLPCSQEDPQPAKPPPEVLVQAMHSLREGLVQVMRPLQ